VRTRVDAGLTLSNVLRKKRMAKILTLKLYPRLQTNSKRALAREKRRWGRPSVYSPKRELILRLAREVGWTQEKVIEQLLLERKLILENPGALIYPDFS